MACNSKVLKHLKGDAKTWEVLSKKAKEEAKSDRSLIKKLKRK